MSLVHACALAILLGILLVVWRVITGPSLVDRLLAVNVVGTKTIVLLLLVGVLYGRLDMFIDIALAYALINFIATIAVLRYLEALARGRMQEAEGGGGPGEGA